MQFNRILEKCDGQVSQKTANDLKVLDREQHALKEKIEFLAKCYEEDQDIEHKVRLMFLLELILMYLSTFNKYQWNIAETSHYI